MIQLELVDLIWQEIRRFIAVPDRSEAAEQLVNLLIDNDFDSEDIRNSLGHDHDIKKAMTAYSDHSDDDDTEWGDDESMEQDHDEWN